MTDYDRLALARARVAELEGALMEALLQLSYMDGRSPSGTTPAVIARINSTLAAKP